MFAHYAVKRNITYAVNIIAEGNIICPQGQTSFGAPALSQVAVARSFFSARAAALAPQSKGPAKAFLCRGILPPKIVLTA